MKKILMSILLVCLLAGCNQNKSHILICALNTSSEEYKAQVTYTYNQDNEIEQMISQNTYVLTASDLEEFTLQEAYDEFTANYEQYKDVDGIGIEIEKDEDKNEIKEIITFTINEYDFNEDAFGLGSRSDYSNIEDIISSLEATNAFTCEKQ